MFFTHTYLLAEFMGSCWGSWDNWLAIGGVAGVVAVRLDTSGWGSGWGSTWGSWWGGCWDNWLVIAGLFGGGGWIANN